MQPGRGPDPEHPAERAGSDRREPTAVEYLVVGGGEAPSGAPATARAAGAEDPSAATGSSPSRDAPRRRAPAVVLLIVGAAAGMVATLGLVIGGGSVAGVAWRSCPNAQTAATVVAYLQDLATTELEALVAADVETLRELLHQDYALITPIGDPWAREELIEAVATGSLDFRRFEPRGEVVVRVDCDTATVSYRSRIEVDSVGSDYRHDAWHTHGYQEQDGRWTVRWSQTTAVGGFPPPGR